MNDTINKDQISKGLKDKVKRIIELYENEKSKSNELNNIINELEKTIKNKEDELLNASSKFDTLNIAKSFEGIVENKDAAKKKIDELKSEIDKCIALLNFNS